MKRLLIAALVAAAIMSAPVAASVDTAQLQGALPQEAGQYLGGAAPDNIDAEGASKSLLQSAVGLLKTHLRESVSAGFMILAVCIIVSVAGGFAKAAGLNIPEKVIDITAVCAILLISLLTSGSVIKECAKSIENLSTFSNILIPAFGIATAVAGKPVTAVASAGATMIFSKLIIAVSQRIFIPAMYLYISACAAASIADSPLLGKAADFVKWLSTAFFRSILIAFTAYLSISGVLTGSADAAAVKTAQVAISGAVPVVGSIISGTSESLLAGAAVLRASVGIYGFLGSCAICLLPFVKAFCHLLVFRLLSVFSSSLAGGGAAKVLDGISTAYSIALGLLGTCCAVQFISIVVSMVVANT